MIKGTVLILGATSDIGLAVAHRFAKEKYLIQLAARNIDKLKPYINDFKIRYQTEVTLHHFDSVKIETHKDFIDNLPVLPNIVVCSVGLMEDQKKCEKDYNLSSVVIRTNYEGPANILAEFANKFEKRKSGTIIGISSVAGERGRASNYYYGSAKAGFTSFLSGLRNRMHKNNVNVITVLPGFVHTKMTQNMLLPKILTSLTSEVAESIYKTYKKKKDKVYIKNIWFFIMLFIKNIPEVIFKKTNF